MGAYQINRPEKTAMAAALAENTGNAAGLILRLALQQGLLREPERLPPWERALPRERREQQVRRKLRRPLQP